MREKHKYYRLEYDIRMSSKGIRRRKNLAKEEPKSATETKGYEEIRSESRQAISSTLPKIVLDVGAAILIWLFARLVFIPVSEGIDFLGYPLPQILNFIVLLALIVIVLKILVDIRKLVDGVAGYAACEIGAPYDVSTEEVAHYRTALVGIFDVIVVSLVYLLFVDFLTNIHPGLAGFVLLVVVVWAIFKIWRVVQAVSSEIKRYTSEWSQKALAKSKG
jgi:hypothetical protein